MTKVALRSAGAFRAFGNADDKIVGVGVGEVRGALTEEDFIPVDGGVGIDALGDGAGIVGGVGGRKLVGSIARPL